MALKKLIDWMQLLSSQERLYRDDGIIVHIYGEEDQSYVVIEQEVSKSPRTVTQYTFHPTNEENSLYAFISFLKVCNFDLKNLVSKIVSANYVEDGMNDIARFEHVEVARYTIQEN